MSNNLNFTDFFGDQSFALDSNNGLQTLFTPYLFNSHWLPWTRTCITNAARKEEPQALFDLPLHHRMLCIPSCCWLAWRHMVSGVRLSSWGMELSDPAKLMFSYNWSRSSFNAMPSLYLGKPSGGITTGCRHSGQSNSLFAWYRSEMLNTFSFYSRLADWRHNEFKMFFQILLIMQKIFHVISSIKEWGTNQVFTTSQQQLSCCEKKWQKFTNRKKQETQPLLTAD